MELTYDQLRQLREERDARIEEVTLAAAQVSKDQYERTDETVKNDAKVAGEAFQQAISGYTVYSKEDGKEYHAYMFTGWVNVVELIEIFAAREVKAHVVSILPYGPILIELPAELGNLHVYDFLIVKENELIRMDAAEFLSRYVFDKLELLVTDNHSL